MNNVANKVRVLGAFLLCLFCVSIRADETPSLPEADLNRLGINAASLAQLNPIYTAPANEAGSIAGLNIRRVLHANVAGNRQLWRVDFAGDYPTDNSTLIWYLDPDSDPTTGRVNAGGVDVIIWVENGVTRSRIYKADGSSVKGPNALVAIKGSQLYMAVDTDLKTQDNKVSGRLRVVSHTTKPLEKISSTPLFAFEGESRAAETKLPNAEKKTQ